MAESPPSTRRLIVLGATGSIGVNTLAVVDHLNRTGAADIEVVGLAAGRNTQALIEQARRFGVGRVAIADVSLRAELEAALPDATIYAGPDAAEQLVDAADCTDLAAAVVGAAGLPATLAAIRKGCRIGLANKETLVAAGGLVTPLLREHDARLLPVDSEHSAIFQCLHEQPTERVRRIVLTASGGPFRTADRQTIENATVEQALNHPTWNMGPKVTIDSASMMNKALEIIEAHWLFGLPADKIDVIVHPQSIAHSFVEFDDGSVLSQMGPPDMRTPIQYALTYPDRPAGCNNRLDWSILSQLTFEPPDLDRFPALRLAYRVIELGGTAGAIFNAANEAAVAAFLEQRIRFGRITQLVSDALDAVTPEPASDLPTILRADQQARAFVRDAILAATPTPQATGPRP